MSTTPYDFNSPVDIHFNELLQAVFHNFTTASRPVTPPLGFAGYNTTENVFQFYGGATAGYYSLAHKTAASVENELLVSVALSESKYGIKRYSGSAGYVKVDGSGVVSSQATPIPISDGGLGLSSYTIGDILYASATTTLSKRNIGSANKVLKSSGTVPVWSEYTISDSVDTFTIAKGTASFTLGAGQSVTGFIDDDTFVTASSTNFASAESIKTYIDSRVYDNISYRPPVTVLFDESGSSLGATTNTIDGITVAVGTRVLVKDSATASQDFKIYIASGSASSWVWTVEQDGTVADLPTDGDTVWIMEGDDHEDQRWNFNGTEWVQTSNADSYTATLPIVITGSVISHSTANGYNHIPATGTSNQILKYASAGTAEWGYVMNINISSSAAINWSKMAALTADYAVITDGAGDVTVEQYLAVSRGGTGQGSWTQYGLVYNPSSSSFGNISGGLGTVLIGTAAAPSFSSNLVLGSSASVTGSIKMYSSANAYSAEFRVSDSNAENQLYYFPVVMPTVNNSILVSNTSGAWSWVSPTFAQDWKVKVDVGATADYIGDSSANGVIRTLGGISYSDGGNYVTLGLNINGLSTQLTTAAINDKLAISDTSAANATKWITTENLFKTVPGSVFGQQFTFTASVAAGGWSGAGPYTIILKNSGASGNGQQNHGMGTDGKFMLLVYSSSGSILSETGLPKTINTSTGDVVIESSALFAGTIHLIHLA